MGQQSSESRRVLSAVMFFPRGGSAHVARSLGRELKRAGWDLTLVSGSRDDLGPGSDAAWFYQGLNVVPIDFTPALAAPDPVTFSDGPPLHPSFEDRADSPDRVFASLDDDAYEHQVEGWAEALQRSGAGSADLLHLHHLTPINEAAARVAPDVPVVGQLHGTELLMLERIASGSPSSWTYADRWAERLRRWASACERLLVSPAGLERALDLLPAEPERLEPTPNGFDPDLFEPREIDRRAFWRRWLVEEPRGWLPGAGPGSARYTDEEIRPLCEGTAIVFVGRFTEVKRVPLLIEAFAAARPGFRAPAGLAMVGGHPGEWEGEHPAETARRCGARDVYLAGWHEHDELPQFFAAADAIALPSAREQFGQVLVEAMACGLPALAAASLGPSLIVDDGRTGWLVETDDREALTAALIELINDEYERRQRGIAARGEVARRFSWPAIGERVSEVFEAVLAAERAVGLPSQAS
jgi:glycosyltransferase involved in cell wall biosynthesis